MTWYFKSIRRSNPAPAARLALRLAGPLSAEVLAELEKLRGSISAKELERAAASGGFADLAELTRDGMGSIVTATMAGAIADALVAGAELEGRKFGGAAIDPGKVRINRWLNEHVAELVKETRGTSVDALRTALRQGIADGKHPTRLAKEVKPLIGLTEPQAAAVARRRAELANSGVPRAKADERAAAYADRLLKQRAELIAQNESMLAVNRGRYELWLDLEAQGALEPGARRRWVTSEDERVCPICGPMNDAAVRLDEQYDLPNGESVWSPPAHVSCRCTDVLE